MDHELRRNLEPSFADLLENPIISKPMPDDRPQKNLVFVERDDEYFQELTKLERAVIMFNPNLDNALTIEQVAHYAVQSNLVKADEISIGVMSRSRYVIMLPNGIAPSTFIRAIPLDIWREGFSFYQWSSADDARLAMPHYKVLIDLVGIPLDLFREKEVIRATSSMGTFLGTVSQPREGDIAVWTVVVATTDLSLIPHQIGYMVGGLETPVEVIPKTWTHCPLYKASEIFQPKEKYQPIFPKTPTPPASKEIIVSNNGDILHISRSALLDLCRGKDPMELPEEVRAAVGGLAMAEEHNPTSVIATVDPTEAHAHNSPQVDTENQRGVEAYADEPVLSQGVVRDTNEAGQNPQFPDSQGVIEGSPVSQKIRDGNKDGNLTDTALSIPPLVTGDKVMGAPSKIPPKILQRNYDNFEIGDCSKSVRSAAIKTVSIFSPPVLRPSTRQKRLIQEQARAARGKPKKRAKKQARIVTKSDGLIEVEVNYGHCYRLAKELGFNTLQVQQALELDNAERAATVFEELDAAGEEETATEGLEEQQVAGEIRKAAAGIEEQHGDGDLNGETHQAVPTMAGLEDDSGVGEKEKTGAGFNGETRHEDGNTSDLGDHLTDFDPDSEDELSSDFD